MAGSTSFTVVTNSTVHKVCVCVVYVCVCVVCVCVCACVCVCVCVCVRVIGADLGGGPGGPDPPFPI